MKQGKHYFDMLSEEEKDYYMESVEKENWKTLEENLKHGYTSFEDFLFKSFVWEDSPMMHDYWFRVSKKYN